MTAVALAQTLPIVFCRLDQTMPLLPFWPISTGNQTGRRDEGIKVNKLLRKEEKGQNDGNYFASFLDGAAEEPWPGETANSSSD